MLFFGVQILKRGKKCDYIMYYKLEKKEEIRLGKKASLFVKLTTLKTCVYFVWHFVRCCCIMWVNKNKNMDRLRAHTLLSIGKLVSMGTRDMRLTRDELIKRLLFLISLWHAKPVKTGSSRDNVLAISALLLPRFLLTTRGYLPVVIERNASSSARMFLFFLSFLSIANNYSGPIIVILR